MNDLPRPPEETRPPARDEWRRDTESRKIAGVCAGLADAFGVSVTLVRAAFVLLALPPFSGIGIVLYLVLWFLMPADGEASGLDRAVDKLTRLVTEPPRRPRRQPRDASFERDETY
jgi:phage shock protein PspC (stress-responsive transcriptional regulator)